MAKPVEIKRIDLLVHPFYSFGGSKYNKEKVNFLADLWKEHIREVAKDPNRLLFITPDKHDPKIGKLLRHAKKKLGNRFGTFDFKAPTYVNHTRFEDSRGNEFESFGAFAKANGFKVDSRKVKTRGLGEYTNNCVTYWLSALNKKIGLENPIPYRNRQSTLLPRKSVSIGKTGYPKPWNRTALLKTKKGREIIRKRMKEHMRNRIAVANEKIQGRGLKNFESRTQLMKRNKL